MSFQPIYTLIIIADYIILFGKNKVLFYIFVEINIYKGEKPALNVHYTVSGGCHSSAAFSYSEASLSLPQALQHCASSLRFSLPLT